MISKKKKKSVFQIHTKEKIRIIQYKKKYE